MARSTYYYELNKVDAIAIRNVPILKEIKRIFAVNKGIYWTIVKYIEENTKIS